MVNEDGSTVAEGDSFFAAITDENLNETVGDMERNFMAMEEEERIYELEL